MMTSPRLLCCALILAAAPRATRGDDPGRELVLHTFSICARDAKTGELGVAVTTRLPDVGRLCPFVKAGVGAVATQAQVVVAYGPKGLDLLEQGKMPQEALDALLADDDQREKRQLGIVDAKGNVAAFTGKECMDHASHRTGSNYTVQGNLLVGRATIDATAEAFEASEGSGLELADRLIAALEAGNRAGGDKRKGNMQSAAVIVAHPTQTHWDGSHTTVDLKVAEHPDPVGELRRQYDAIRQNLGHRTFALVEGRDVRQLKQRLHDLGLLRKEADAAAFRGYLMSVEGRQYDRETADAVDAFRKEKGLSPPGGGGGQARGLVDREFVEALRAAWMAAKRASGEAVPEADGDA